MIDDTTIREALAAIVGPDHVLVDQSDIDPYLREWLGLFSGRTRAVVRPASSAQVSDIMKFCHVHGIPVVPQGGNTGLVGGQIPEQDGMAIVLSLTRLNRILEIDVSSDTMTVEAGVTLYDVQEAAKEAGRLFPLSLASEGSCTIGGNLATNAGGTAVLAFGNARDLVLGLEVVLPDGRLWSGLGKLRKDNTGYDLKNLFIGSEGTLGVITAVVLKLFPQPREVATCFVGMPSVEAALALLSRAKARLGSQVTTFEIMPREALEFVLRHKPSTRDPLETPHAWNVLLELSSPYDDALTEVAEALITEAMDAGIADDAVIAANLQQQRALWGLRELLAEVQGHEGASIKHDIALPLSVIPRFIEEVVATLKELVPGCRPLPFGHLGDGNLHFNVSQPVGVRRAEFLSRQSEIKEAVLGATIRYGGSISAEHGIGQLKLAALAKTKDPVALDMMRLIKNALDPNGILNPGKVMAPR